MGDASRSYASPSHPDPDGRALPPIPDFDALGPHHPGVGASRSRQYGQQPDGFMNAVNAADGAGGAGAGGGGGGGGGGVDDGPDSAHPQHHHGSPMTGDATFDILAWYPAYQSCQRFFLDVAQHEPGTQAVCALINIRLPFQYLSNPILSSSSSTTTTSSSPSSHAQQQPQQQQHSPSDPNHRSPSTQPQPYQFTFSSLPSPPRHQTHQPPPSSPTPFISLIPYIRRLAITGFDKPAILHGFFGDDYTLGILPHLDCERRNYLFAARHGGWRTCKNQYDVGSGRGGDGGETVPFMKPLEDARVEELAAAEKAWRRWLAMEDWMVGPHAPAEGVEEGEMGGGTGRGRWGGEAGRDGRTRGRWSG